MLSNLASSVSDLQWDQSPPKVPFLLELPCSAVDTCIEVSDKRVTFQDSEVAKQGKQTGNGLLAGCVVVLFFSESFVSGSVPSKSVPLFPKQCRYLPLLKKNNALR